MSKSGYVRTTLILPKDKLHELKKRCLNEKISMTQSFEWFLNKLDVDKRTTRDILGVKEDV